MLWHWGFSKSPWKKKFIDDAIFYFWWRHQQSSFWPANYAPVMWVVIYCFDCHHFTIGIADLNFNCIPCLELKLLVGGGNYICFFYTTYTLFPWPFCLHTSKSTYNFPILTQPPNCEHLIIADTLVQTRRGSLFKGSTLTWNISYLYQIVN